METKDDNDFYSWPFAEHRPSSQWLDLDGTGRLDFPTSW